VKSQIVQTKAPHGTNLKSGETIYEDRSTCEYGLWWISKLGRSGSTSTH